MQWLTYEPTGVAVDYVDVINGELFAAETIPTGGGCTAVQVTPRDSRLAGFYALLTDENAAVPTRDDDGFVGIYHVDTEQDLLASFDYLSPSPEYAAAQLLAAFRAAGAPI